MAGSPTIYDPPQFPLLYSRQFGSSLKWSLNICSSSSTHGQRIRSRIESLPGAGNAGAEPNAVLFALAAMGMHDIARVRCGTSLVDGSANRPMAQRRRARIL